MKKILLTVAILLLFITPISFGYAAETKTTSSYDWKLHQELIDKQFEEYAQQVLQTERQEVESLLTKDKADKYMEYFERGMRSNGGAIMMEGGESRWLEIAYQSGYKQKELFRQGYFEGLVKSAESSGVTATGQNITEKKALDIAKKAIKDKNIKMDNYYLKSVKDLKSNEVDIWFITFDLKEKLEQLKNKRPITKGGEIFVLVDKKTGEATIRYGE